MKKIFLVLMICFLLIGCDFQNRASVKIVQYQRGPGEMKKEISIKKYADIKKLEEYIDIIDSTELEQVINIVVQSDIEVYYNNDIKIAVDSTDMRFCYYENSSKNVSKLTFLPDGFLDWVSKKIK